MLESDAMDSEIATALEHARLEGMSLAHLQQKRSAHSSKATFETDNGQRPVAEASTTTPKRVDCEDDNPASEYTDGSHCDPPQGPIVRSQPATFHRPVSPHSVAPERADGSLPFGQQEKQVNIDSRKLETRSDEIDYFTSFYYVDGQYETVNLNNSRRRIGSEANT